MTHDEQHCQRPWWKRPPFWFIVIAAMVVLAVVAVEQTGGQPAIPYSAFLDQLEAGNITRVTLNGTEITGRTARGDSLRSHVPDFGGPMLIPSLREMHVVIEVVAPSAWSRLLGRVPWPMLMFVGAILVLGLVRPARGGTAQPGGAAAALPAHGIVGLMSGLFAKRSPAKSPPERDSDAPKPR